MGRMVKMLYIGAFINVVSEGFQEISKEDEFYEDFYETGIFRTAYQGLEKIDVLIPCSDYYNFNDDYDEEFYMGSFKLIEPMKHEFEHEYKDHIEKLKTKYNIDVEVMTGLVSYWDEIA